MFCPVCKADIEKLKRIQKEKQQLKAQMKADAMPGAKPVPEPAKPISRPGGVPGAPGRVCKCGAPLEPGAKWCDICGEKV
jgi:hypothetical protein